jgi:predicted SpoU family rRNA methylase
MIKAEREKVSTCVAQFVENMNADSVVILWTEVAKESTKAKVASWGNQFAIKQMVIDLASQYINGEDPDEKKGKAK